MTLFLNTKEWSILSQLNWKWNQKVKSILTRQANELQLIYVYQYRPDHIFVVHLIYSTKEMFGPYYGLVTKFMMTRKNTHRTFNLMYRHKPESSLINRILD